MKSSHVKSTAICAVVGYLKTGFEVVVHFGKGIKFCPYVILWTILHTLNYWCE